MANDLHVTRLNFVAGAATVLEMSGGVRGKGKADEYEMAEQRDPVLRQTRNILQLGLWLSRSAFPRRFPAPGSGHGDRGHHSPAGGNRDISGIPGARIPCGSATVRRP